MVRKVNSFLSSDDKLHRTREEACRHELMLALTVLGDPCLNCIKANFDPVVAAFNTFLNTRNGEPNEHE